MRKVYTSIDPVGLAHVRAALENAGIPARVLNEAIAMSAGGTAPDRAHPEIWVENDDDEARARSIIARYEAGELAAQRPAWKCPSCGETIEGQFTECWNCHDEA